jgi:hypothetical protein
MARDRSQEPLPQRYLTPIELAALLGVPVQTIYQWRHRRTGPARIQGGSPPALRPQGRRQMDRDPQRRSRLTPHPGRGQ